MNVFVFHVLTIVSDVKDVCGESVAFPRVSVTGDKIRLERRVEKKLRRLVKEM